MSHLRSGRRIGDIQGLARFQKTVQAHECALPIHEQLHAKVVCQPGPVLYPRNRAASVVRETERWRVVSRGEPVVDIDAGDDRSDAKIPTLL